MTPLQLHVNDLRPNDRRAGVVAFHEMLVVFLFVAGLIVLLRMVVMAAISMDAISAGTNSRALSDRGICRISLDRDGGRLWVVRPRQGAERLNVATGELEKWLPCSELDIVASAFSPDGSTALLCGGDGTVILSRNGEESRIDSLIRGELILRASVSENGSVSACVTDQGRMHVWTRDGSELQKLTHLLPAVPAILEIGLDRTGRRFYVARRDGTVSFHASQSGDIDGSALRVEEGCVACAWSHDERSMGLVTPRGRVKVIEVATGRILFDRLMNEVYLRNPTYTAAAILQLSPDGSRIATSTIATNEIHVWDLTAGKLVASLQGHAAPVRTVQFSSTSDVLYSGSYDGTIREWSLTSCSQRRLFD